MRAWAETIGACCVAALLVVVLAVADLQTVDDAAYSPLYQNTLKNSYDRFKQTDERVPAKAPDDAAVDWSDSLDGPADSQTSPGRSLRSSPRSATGADARGRSAIGADARKASASGADARRRSASGQGDRNSAEAAGSQRNRAAPRPRGHGTPGVHLARGNELSAERQYDQALEEFRKEIEANPQSALAQHRIADMLHRLGRPEEAVAAYRDVLKIQPAYHCVHIHMGDIYTSLGKTKEAEAAYAIGEAAYRMQVEAGGAEAASARYHLAAFHLNHGKDPAQAVAWMEQTVTEFPQNTAYLRLLARCYEAAGRSEDAQSAANRAAAFDAQQAASDQPGKAMPTSVPAEIDSEPAESDQAPPERREGVPTSAVTPANDEDAAVRRP